MKNKVDLGFGVIEFYDDYAIGIMNEGAHLSNAEDIMIFSCCEDIFGGKPFGYISNRLNSYSINPMAHKSASNNLDSLIAYAVVAQTPAHRLSYSVERIFLEKPIAYFTELNLAKEWISNALKTARENNHLNPERTRYPA